MTTLVVGATGATGRLLVDELISRKQEVRLIVRSPEKIPERWRGYTGVSIVNASLLDLNDAEMRQQVQGCDAVASCLGHTLNLRGIYGKPRRLVTDAVRRLCDAVKAVEPASPTRFVLMNTTGNRNRDLREPVSFGERLAVGLMRILLPPQADNEQAADYLRTAVGPDDESIEWAVVRPDTLTDDDAVSPYDVFPSPTRSAIFNPGTTSRINVAHFMARLITEDEAWNEWNGKMPVIYNRGRD